MRQRTMRRRERHRVLPCLLLGLLVTGHARGGDDGEPSYELTASLSNLPEGGAVFKVSGTAEQFPSGTLLHVTLFVKGQAPKPIEAAFFPVPTGPTNCSTVCVDLPSRFMLRSISLFFNSWGCTTCSHEAEGSTSCASGFN